MDAVVLKLGGSLALYPDKLRILCTKLGEISGRRKLIIIPGGGEFADVARNMDKKFKLSHQTAHQMAILGMDQYGLLLSDLISQSKTVTELKDIRNALDLGRLIIFLPSAFMFREDPLEHSWNVTSDSISVYLASQLGIRKVILITDVDGIYADNPKKSTRVELIAEISPEKLQALNKRTSVDRFLPKLLMHLDVECFVVNGLYPERVVALLEGKETVCTQIKQS